MGLFFGALLINGLNNVFFLPGITLDVFLAVTRPNGGSGARELDLVLLAAAAFGVAAVAAVVVSTAVLLPGRCDALA